MDVHRVAFFQLFRDAIMPMFQKLNLHRVEAEVALDAPDSWHRWMAGLGFAIECRKKQYGPGRQDYLGWVWLRED